MRKDITIAAESRESRGKNEARRLRVKGFMPAVLYGSPGEPVAVAVNPKEISKILSSKTGHNTIFNLQIVNGENAPVMIVDWQNDPIRDSLLHADLKRIDLQKRIIVKVPVITVGDPKGVKLQGGLHEVITREVEIECLPDDIPQQFTMDVTELALGAGIRASDLPMSGSMELLSPADTLISHVVAIKVEAEPVVGETEAVAAEPEVAKKGKKEAEGGEAAAAPPPKKK